MKINALPKDADELIAFAQWIATALAEKQEQLGIGTESEKSLRTAIAAATFAGDVHLAALTHVEKSPEARRFLAETKRRRDRSLEQLRRRVTRSIRRLSNLTEEELLGVH